MKTLLRCTLLVAALAAISQPVQAQLTLGAGGGTGTGTRGGGAGGGHGTAFLEVRVPMLSGIRADAMWLDTPTGNGRVSLALNGVISLPTPVITPYALGGWGKYGIQSDSAARTGWNYGVGVRTSGGTGLFVEWRRHQRVARDLITVGVVF